MEFTIYTLGDNAMFRAILTGVAMIFDPANSDTWVSTGGVGIGAAAALGLLLSLILLLFMAIQSQKFELGLMLVLVIAYAALFVPKFTVNLEDIYGGGVTKVDNIPLGIALPAALASNLAYDLGSKLETVFSTVDGNYLSQSQEGFLTPLKVLASLRNGWKEVYNRDPDLAASLFQYAQICGSGKINQQAMNTSMDPVNYLLTNPPTSGQTLYYSSATGSYPNGELMSCANAAAKLIVDAGNLVNNTGLAKVTDIINGAMDTGKGKDSKQGYTAGDLDTYLIAVTGASVGDAKAMTSLTLLIPFVNKGMGCQAGQNMQYCLQYSSAEEQRKEDAAAGGNFFLRTMKNGSNMFAFVLYAFSPVVALLLVATGGKGIKVAGSYLMLLIWVNSWLIFAAIINYYIQLQMKNEFFMAGGAQTLLTMSGYAAFYDKLSQKIMLASDMMGMIPMLSLALLSGSIYALTSVAGKWGSDGIKSNYDEKVNSPQLLSAQPNTVRESSHSLNANTGLVSTTGLANPTMSVGKTLEGGISSASQAKIAASNELSRSSEDLLRKSMGKAEQWGNGWRHTESDKSYKSEQEQMMASAARQISSGINLHEGESAAVDRATVGVAGTAMSLGASFAGNSAQVKASLEQQLRSSGQIAAGREKVLAEQIVNNAQNVASKAHGWEQARQNDITNNHESVFADQNIHDQALKVSEAYKKSTTASQGYDEVAGLKVNAGWSNNLDYLNLGNNLVQSGAGAYLEQQESLAKQENEYAYNNAHSRAVQDVNMSVAKNMAQPQKEALIRLLALDAVKPSAALQGLRMATPQAFSYALDADKPTANAGMNTDPNRIVSSQGAAGIRATATAAGNAASDGATKIVRSPGSGVMPTIIHPVSSSPQTPPATTDTTKTINEKDLHRSVDGRSFKQNAGDTAETFAKAGGRDSILGAYPSGDGNTGKPSGIVDLIPK